MEDSHSFIPIISFTGIQIIRQNNQKRLFSKGTKTSRENVSGRNDKCLKTPDIITGKIFTGDERNQSPFSGPFVRII